MFIIQNAISILGSIPIERGRPDRLVAHPGSFMGNDHVIIYATQARTYYLCATNETIQRKWLECLKQTIAGIPLVSLLLIQDKDFTSVFLYVLSACLDESC